jgi:hypothetical protein
LLGRASRPEDAFILGWWFVLLCLNLSGEVKSETGRIWLFLTFPGLLIGIAALGQTFRASRALRPLLLLVLVAFALQAAVTGYFLGGRVPEATAPEARWFVPAGATRLSYQLGDAIALQGYTARPSGNDLAVTLYWKALGWTRADYLAFVHLLDEEDVLIVQSDHAPANGRLPTWCWVPGEVVEDLHLLPGVGATSSSFQLGVGMYDWRTGERLPVTPPAAGQIIWLPAGN